MRVSRRHRVNIVVKHSVLWSLDAFSELQLEEIVNLSDETKIPRLPNVIVGSESIRTPIYR